MIGDPDYSKIILSFGYRGFKIEIARDRFSDRNIYLAWANYESGSAIAVPYAATTKLAIKQAKKWVDRRLEDSSFSLQTKE